MPATGAGMTKNSQPAGRVISKQQFNHHNNSSWPM
jgi:hypothetical protein